MICYSCGSEEMDEHTKLINERIICKECLNSHASQCCICKGFDLTSHMYIIQEEYYCDDCRDEHTFACYHCGEEFHMEEMGYNNADFEKECCKQCMDLPADFKPLSPYNYVPRELKFYKTRLDKQPLYMGFELEVELLDEETQLSTMRQVNTFIKRNKIDKYFYFKMDSSLRRGIEVVSHPATYNYINKYFKMGKFLKWLKSIAEVSTRCGLHVHVKKEALAGKSMSALQYFAFVNRKELFCLSGRDVKLITNREKIVNEEWIKHLSFCGYQPMTRENVKNGRIRREKYIAIAYREHTIEFRLFGGTLNAKRLKDCLKLVQSLIDYFQHTPAEVVADYPEFKHFMAFMRKKRVYDTLKPVLKNAKENKICGMKIF